MNALDLNLEVLEDIEAPMDTLEGVGLCMMALGSGILIGMLVAT